MCVCVCVLLEEEAVDFLVREDELAKQIACEPLQTNRNVNNPLAFFNTDRRVHAAKSNGATFCAPPTKLN